VDAEGLRDPDAAERRMERILVALDGSEHSDKALDLASDIAGKYAAELVLLHVMSDKPLTDAERQMAEVEYLDELVSSLDASRAGAGGDPRLRAQRVLQHYADVAHRFREAMGNRLITQARKRAGEKRVRAVQTLLEDGDPAKTILRVAKGLGVDMIFLGSRGLGDIKGLLMGSVSHKVAQLAECTCVSVK
jgi:nucleotide-binding universal stress UspA family protein